MKWQYMWTQFTDVIRRTETRVYLVASLIAGAIMRVYKLGFQSLWRDELVIWHKSSSETITQILAQGHYDRRPSGYQIISHGVQRYFGDSEAALRAPSVIAGLLAIFMIYVLGKRIYGKKEGVWCAVLMACSWSPLFYSQEARPYAMLLCLAVITGYLWWEIRALFVMRNETASWWNKGGRMRQIMLPALYVLSILCMCSLHYVGLLFIGLQLFAMMGYIILHRRWKVATVMIALGALTVVLFHGWYTRGITHPFIALQPDHFGLVIFGWRIITYLIGMLWGGGFIAGILTIVFIVAIYGGAAIRSWWMRRIGKGRRRLTFIELLHHPTTLATLWLVVPYAITYLGSLNEHRLLVLRYLIVILPAVYLLCARALSKLFAPCWLGVLVIVVLNVYMLHFHTHYYTTPQKPQPREAVYYLAQQDIDYRDAAIICYRCGGESLQYYLPRAQAQERLARVPTFTRVDHTRQLAAIIDEHEFHNIWVIYTNMPFIGLQKFSSLRGQTISSIHTRHFRSAGVLLLQNP